MHWSRLKHRVITPYFITPCFITQAMFYIDNYIYSYIHRYINVDIWFRRRTVCRVKVKFDKSSTDSVELLPHLTETAVPNWFRGRSFVVLNSSVRFGTWVERRLNRTLLTTPKGYQLCRRLATYSLGYYGLRNQRHHWNQWRLLQLLCHCLWIASTSL